MGKKVQNVGSDCMNKKGFTLIELLAVIVLIGLIFGLAVPGINKIRTNVNKKSLEKKVALIEKSAVLWGQDNKTRLLRSDCDGIEEKCYKIKVSELISDNYLDGDNNSNEYKNPITGDTMENDCIYVYKKNNRVYAKYFEPDHLCTNDS